MGRGEGQVEKEGARAVVGAQELDRRAAEELGGVAVAQVASGGAVLPAGIEVEEGHPVVVAHPAEEDAVPPGEAALEAPGVVVPLAHVVGVVAGPAELLGEGGHGGVMVRSPVGSPRSLLARARKGLAPAIRQARAGTQTPPVRPPKW